MLDLKNPDDLYIGLLQSDHVMDGIVQRFDLKCASITKDAVDRRAENLKSHTKILPKKAL